MIPDERFSTEPIRGQLLNPWSRDRKISYHWGPVQVQDTSQGLLARLWMAEVVDDIEVVLSAPDVVGVSLFSWDEEILNIALAFDQNGFPCVAFSDTLGRARFYWWDPVPADFTFFVLSPDVSSPFCYLDDARQFNIPGSDIILGYVQGGGLKYRRHRDRYTVEYVPVVGPSGSPVSADILYHASMNDSLRGEWIYGHLPTIIDAPNIMKKQILLQKAPGEVLPVVFNFYHLMLFGEVIEGAAVVITVHSGEDADPSTMLDGDCTFTDREVTQLVQGGLVGVVYRISMSVRTDNGCVYVMEGMLAINDSPAEAPSNPD